MSMNAGFATIIEKIDAICRYRRNFARVFATQNWTLCLKHHRQC